MATPEIQLQEDQHFIMLYVQGKQRQHAERLLDQQWLTEVTTLLDEILAAVSLDSTTQVTIVEDPDYKPERLGWGSVCGGGTEVRIESLAKHFTEKHWEVRISRQSSMWYLVFSRRKTVWDHLMTSRP